MAALFMSLAQAGLLHAQTAAETKSNEPLPVDQEIVELSPFEVSDSNNRGYRATNSVSATRLDTPIVELSKNIQVLTRDLIDDLKASDFDEALYLSASVQPSGGYQGRFSVRGFENITPKRNGLSSYGTDESVFDTATVERIEVVKGPSSLLYGSSSPGGVVNYETKKPLPEQYASVRLVAGSWKKLRGEIDAGGPLVGDGQTLNYRFVAAAETTESFTDYVEGDRSVFAGTVRWYVAPKTYVQAGIERTDSERTNIRQGGGLFTVTAFQPGGAEVYNQGLRYGKSDRELGQTNPHNRHDVTVTRYDLDFSHEFTPRLSLFAHYNYLTNELQEAAAYSGAEGLERGFPAGTVGQNQVAQLVSWRAPDRKDDNGTINLNANFDLPGQNKIDIVLGYEFYKFDLDFEQHSLKTQYQPILNLATRDGYLGQTWANMRSGVLQGIADGIWNFGLNLQRSQEYTAPYALAHLKLFDNRLRLIGGVRRDEIDIEQSFNTANTATPDPFDLGPTTVSRFKTAATTMMGGVSWQPLAREPGFAVYANYSESLLPNEIVNPDGSTLPPQTGEGVEVGLKLDISERISATLSYFKIDKTNVPRSIPNSAPTQWETSGLQRSEGVDLDLFYAITPEWQVLLSASKLDAYYVSDQTAALVGKRIGFVPESSYSLWTKRSFTSGPLKGFSLGGGVVHTGEAIWDARLPLLVFRPFTRVDLLFGYDTTISGKPVNFSVKLNNLLDEVYITRSDAYGDPFNVQTSVTIRF